MLETQLRSASVRPGLGAKVRYAPRLSGADRPGRSPINITIMRAPRMAPISSPNATPAPAPTTARPPSHRPPAPGPNHGLSDLDPIDGQSRNEASDEFDRVSIDRRRRQAIADGDRKLARAPVVAPPPSPGGAA